MTAPDSFAAKKQAELDRWTKWWRRLSDSANRALHIVDTIEQMDPDEPAKPGPYSADEAAGIAGDLLPILIEMTEYGSSSQEAAQLLRDAAARIEE